MTPGRLKAAAKAALIHFLGGVAVAALAAGLIFGLWFPYPYNVILGGNTLFLLLCGVDVVCGPILTLVLYSPTKPRAKWLLDIGLILLVQFSALVYGLHSIALTRPVWLAFEGDRLRIVKAVEVHGQYLPQAQPGLTALPWTGPRLIAVRALDKSDPAFLESVQRAMQGDFASFYPQRWIAYEQRSEEVRQLLYPLAALENRPGMAALRELIENKTGLSPAQQDAQLGYLPLVQGATLDWVAVLNKTTALPVAYGHVVGW